MSSSGSSSSSLQKLLCGVGLVSLVHCACSAAQHRSYIRLTEQEFVGLPLDVLVQTLVSLLLVIYSASHVAGHFMPIRADLQARTKSWDAVGGCPSFYVFDHRAKALSPYFNSQYAPDDAPPLVALDHTQPPSGAQTAQRRHAHGAVAS